MKKDVTTIENLSIKKKYAQYYTNPELGQVLIKSLPDEMVVNNVVDLSAGEGSLLLWCKRKFPRCVLHAIDIDSKNIKILREKGIQAELVDATTEAINGIISDETFCLSLGNPPFKTIEANKQINDLFDFYKIPTCRNVRAENYFLLYSLHIVKENGMVVFIVPESLISGEKNKLFRSVLAQHFQVVEVVEIPRGVFSGTEAKTFIISIKKTGFTSKIKLSYFDKNDNSININKDDFIERSDYKFYARSVIIKKTALLHFDVLRGDVPGKYAKNEPANTIHTTSFKKELNYFSNAEVFIADNDRISGREGDIVIPRVGSRSLGKVGVISNGHFKLSDCIFLIRPVNEKEKKMIVSFLISSQGQEFISSISKGVGASYITLKDMRLLPKCL